MLVLLLMAAATPAGASEGEPAAVAAVSVHEEVEVEVEAAEPLEEMARAADPTLAAGRGTATRRRSPEERVAAVQGAPPPGA